MDKKIFIHFVSIVNEIYRKYLYNTNPLLMIIKIAYILINIFLI